MKEVMVNLKNGCRARVYITSHDEDEYCVQFLGPRGGLLFTQHFTNWEMKQLADLFNAGYRLSGS